MELKSITSFITFCLSFLIFATIIINSQPINNSHENHCRNIFGSNGLQEIECPLGKPVIQVEIRELSANTSTKNRKVKLNFQCDKEMKPENFSLLPDTNIGDITEVEFRYCPLPLGTPIVNIIKRFGNPMVVRFQFSAEQDETILPIHLKDLNEIQRLQLKNIIFSGSSEDLFANTTKLKWMDLRYTNANNMPKDIFKPLINLTTLELGGSKIEKLSPGMFSNQKHLLKLNLWSNSLKTLPGSVFEGVISLNNLDLMLNDFETFDNDSFALLKNLTNINLSANYLTSLPENLFSENQLLSEIRIQGNQKNLTELPSGLFSNLINLKSVALRKDGIRIIPSNLFKGSFNIETIHIFENDIEKLPNEIFEDLINLETLNLNNNKLTTIDDNTFGQNAKLTFLDLSSNQLETLSKFAFNGLKNLKNLLLNDNKLINFQPETMEPLINLQSIFLQNNQLNFKLDDFRTGSPLNKLTEIKNIHLQNNSVTKIYQDWYTSLIKLELLDLSYNKIKEINKKDLQFTRPKLLLDLSHNSISLIDLNRINYEHDTYDVSNSIIEINITNNPINCNCHLSDFINLINGRNTYKEISKHLVFNYKNLTCTDTPINWPYNLTERHIAEVNPHEFVCTQTENACPKNCFCWYRSFDNSVLVNCSNAGLTEVPNLHSLSNKSIEWIELHIENNEIKELPTIKKSSYNKVQELYIQNNKLIYLKPENIPESLRILNIANNQLQAMNITTLSAINRTRTITSISLSGNKWKCNCDTKNFIFFVQSKHNFINDINQMKCEDGKRIATITPVDICFIDNTLIIAMCIVLVLLAIFIGAVVALYYKYQLEFKLWLFEHNLFLSLITEEELDKNKKYDAFISYSHVDESFVTDELVPNLENGTHPFKLCLHVRDWVPGEWIQTQIQNSVENSRRTIVILSKNFLESVWGQMEFRTAHTAALTEGRARVIVIIYGDIGDIEKLDPKLKVYLKTNTYVKWGDPWFWNKLRYAMPHPQNVRSLKSKTKGLCKTTMKSSTDDKLELIKPTSVTPPLKSTPPANSACTNPLLAQLTPSLNGNIPSPNGSIITTDYTNGTTIKTNGINPNLLQHNGQHPNGLIHGAFIINTNSKQSDV